MKTIGEILKSLREEKNISMDEMVEQLKAYGVNPSKSMISRWENNKADPSMEYARILSRFYNVTLDYIIGTSDKKESRLKRYEDMIEFKTPQEAMSFILSQPAIMGFGGFDPSKMSDDDVLDFANELLNQLKLLSYKYKK